MPNRWSAIFSVVFLALLLPVNAPAQEPLPVFSSTVTGMPSMALPDHIQLAPACDLENPASFLYPEWDNRQSIGNYGDLELPDTVFISMAGYCMPTDSTYITDSFGYRPRRGRVHNGLDVKVQVGDTIRVAFDGKVRVSEYQRRGYGHYLVVRHPNGLETVYGHMSKKLVDENQIVHAGDPIGLGGNTGRSTGSHLHFETRLLGRAINPALLFDFTRNEAATDCYVYVAKSAPVYYKVRKGDTLGAIAARNQTSVSQLCKINGISSSSILREGQTIRIK